MSDIKLTINDKEIIVPDGTTILEAAKQLNIHIPTLCHLNLHNMKFVNQTASCRVCVVEEVGYDRMLAACSTPCKNGMKIRTNTVKVIRARKMMVELLLSNHPTDCLVCSKNRNCELQTLAANTGVTTINYPGERLSVPVDESSYSLLRNMNKCILCKRCETMCNDVQTVGTLTDVGRGFNTVVGTAFNMPIMNTNCTFCGQCISVCPTAAISEMNNTEKLWLALDSKKTVIVQTAPAVRVALGELFDMPIGTNVTGKMVTALRNIGFNMVFDTNFAADVTIMEEAAEIVQRLNDPNAKLPILTSCCPAWVKFIEHNFPGCIDIPSSAKSPHEMFGALAKTYLAEKLQIPPEDIVVVSIMPCVAKKYESARPELANNLGQSDVDIVITTRELGQIIKDLGIDFKNLEDSDFDQLMGVSSGAGDIFGTTGGVIEAALRTAYFFITGQELEDVEFHALRGLDGIKEADIEIAGRNLKIAVANGLGPARKILENIQNGTANYSAIEIMACPGGCVAGGGQPFHGGNDEIIKQRAAAIYTNDRLKTVRKSHLNPMVQKLYKEYLGEPLGQKAHQLLHTTFIKRNSIGNIE